MANGNLVSITPDQAKGVEESLASMEKILKDKDAMIRSGVFSKEEIERIQITYDSTKKLYAIYGPQADKK